jgi:hypothetical protein
LGFLPPGAPYDRPARLEEVGRGSECISIFIRERKDGVAGMTKVVELAASEESDGKSLRIARQADQVELGSTRVGIIGRIKPGEVSGGGTT